MENIQKQHSKSKNRGIKSIVLGLLVLATGVALLLKNSGIFNEQTSNVIFSWQMLLFIIGVVNIWSKKFMYGFIAIFVGCIIIIADYYGFSVNNGNIILSVVIIIYGITILFKIIEGKIHKKSNPKENSKEFFEDISILAISEQKLNYPSLKHGRIYAIFGKSKLNLQDCQNTSQEIQFEVNCIFGGTTLIIPPDWNVTIKVYNIFGGFSDNRQIKQIDHSKTLIIKGFCFFGVGKLKS